MKILAIADTEERWLTDFYDRDRMAGVDLIISCGDLPARYLEHIVTLANVPLVYVWGNHDTEYRQHLPEGCISIEGHIREFQGLRLMGLGGSIKYNDRVYGFTESEMYRRATRMALLAYAAGGVDMIVTHAPARGYGDMSDLPHRGLTRSTPCSTSSSRRTCCTATFIPSTAASSACGITRAARRS